MLFIERNLDFSDFMSINIGVDARKRILIFKISRTIHFKESVIGSEVWNFVKDKVLIVSIFVEMPKLRPKI